MKADVMDNRTRPYVHAALTRHCMTLLLYQMGTLTVHKSVAKLYLLFIALPNT